MTKSYSRAKRTGTKLALVNVRGLSRSRARRVVRAHIERWRNGGPKHPIKINHPTVADMAKFAMREYRYLQRRRAVLTVD